MAEVTKMALHTFGINDITTVYDAERAFASFCEATPDLVITDWLKDPNNGLALTRRIRSDKASPNPFVPIILTMGYSLKKRILMARDAGVSEILAKPFTAKTLAQKIEQIIEAPKSFVVCDTYIGPDRRHEGDGSYAGPDRRKNPPNIVNISDKSIDSAISLIRKDEKE